MTELPNKIINNCQGSFYKNRAVKEMHEINKEHIQIYIYIYIYIYQRNLKVRSYSRSSA